MTLTMMMMIDDFDEDNDSKSEVNHWKNVNDEPQKETRKRKALDTAEEESPKNAINRVRTTDRNSAILK